MALLNLQPELREMASADSSVAQLMPRKRTKMDIIGAIFEALASGYGAATGNRSLMELGGRGAAMRDRAEQQRRQRAQQIEDEQRTRAQDLSDQERAIAIQERRRQEDFERQLIANAKRKIPESTAKRHKVEPELLAAGRPKTPQEKAEEDLLVQLGLIDDPRYQRLEEHRTKEQTRALQTKSDIDRRRQIAVGRAVRQDEDPPLYDEEGRLTLAGEQDLTTAENRARARARGTVRGGLGVQTTGAREFGGKVAGATTQRTVGDMVGNIAILLREEQPELADAVASQLEMFGRTGAPDSYYMQLMNYAKQAYQNPENGILYLKKIMYIGQARTPTPPGASGVGRVSGER